MMGRRWLLGCLLVTAILATLAAGADTTHSILGRITTDGKPLEGVTVDFGDKLASVLTDDAGYYESEGAVEGDVYLLEPAAAGWTFAPARRAVVMGSGDEQVNFVAEPVGGQLAGLLFAPPTAASAHAKDGVFPDLLYPVGGETWKQGGSYNIRWTYEGNHPPMRIRLSKGGITCATITSGTPNDGSFWWKVPATVEPASDYAVYVIDQGSYADTSGEFTVEATPLVTYPTNAGVCWRRGQGYQIKWQGFPGANVKIQLYRGSLLSRGIAWSTPNDGSFWWSVPGDQRTADNYRIKITARNNSAISDKSDKPFAIVNNPRVTYPTEPGVEWEIGGSYTITWRQFVADQVKIDLIAGTTLSRVVTQGTTNDGSFHWQVPYDLQGTGGSVYKIRVTAVGCPAQSDKSNNWFDIEKAPAVTYPTGNGITWNLGSPYVITWHGFAASNVKIELLKGWALDRVISNSTINDQSFKWWVPVGQKPGADYRIRITATSGASQQDVSDRNFSIACVPLVTYPTSLGIEWDHGDSVQIRWQGFEGSAVRIELRQWGVVKKVIAYGATNDGSFWWKAFPDGMESGGGFKVRVIAQPALTVDDESNQYFRINPKPIVVRPNTNEWLHGPVDEIRWSGFEGASVRIELWDGASFDHVIQASTPNDGSYDWTISGAAGDQYRIRVSSLSGPFVADFSDQYFTMGPK